MCVGGCSFVRCMVHALGYNVLFIFGVGEELVLTHLLPRLFQKRSCLYFTSSLKLAVLSPSDLTNSTYLRPGPVGSGSSLGGGSVGYALRKNPVQFVPDLISTLTLTYSRNSKHKPQIPNPRPQTPTLTLSIALIITCGKSWCDFPHISLRVMFIVMARTIFWAGLCIGGVIARTIVGFIVRQPFLAKENPQLGYGHLRRPGVSNYNLLSTMYKDLVTIICVIRSIN